MQTTTLIFLLTGIIAVLVLIIAFLVWRMACKNDELRHKNKCLVREMERSQTIIERAVKYVFPAGQKLGWHHHPVINYGVLVQGELTIIGQDGKEKVVHEGEAVVEMVNTIHHGENRGSKPVILYMFYLSKEGEALAVQHPEIPLE